MSNPLPAMLSISSLRGWCTLPMQIQNLVYVVSRVKFSSLPFLILLTSSITCLQASHLALASSGRAFANTTWHLLSRLWLLRWTTPFSMVRVLTHSGYMAPSITRWELCILEMVELHPMPSFTFTMNRLHLLHATTVIQTWIMVSWESFRTC